ncbi:MAG TPA: ECF-type sigma factor [Candidatus Acidoferrales bacterium]|jgi:DNA-directed RNA polymerase specialized sigma24 family protein|nr:ECF-type sigma factor [Candidatus Acidoferrales bacterium]
MSDITLLLDAISRGESRASEDLLPLIYDELRRLAAARMAGEAAGQTLQPTALVHEAWLRLVNEGGRIVILKFFGGLTNKEVARILGVTERSIERQWSYAKTCLLEMIQTDL